MWLPGLWKIPNWRIRRLSGKGRHEAAGAVTARYVQRRPADVHGWVDLGSCLLHAKDYRGATDAMRRGLEHHNHNPRLTFTLVRAMVGLGDLDEAEALLDTDWEDSLEAFFRVLAQIKVAKAKGNDERV